MSQLLEARGVSKHFGGITALDGVDLTVDAGAIVGLIGPNGSGKTTLLNTMNGVYRPDEGEIHHLSDRLDGSPKHGYARRGIARTFQAARVFQTLTPMENMLVATLSVDEPRAELERRALALLTEVQLDTKLEVAASELSGGQQKLLEFARAMMIEPAVVLMDEPFAGVHPDIKKLLHRRIREANERGTSFVIVSHEIPELMALSTTVVCLSAGKVIAQGAPETVQHDAQVVDAYLGGPRDHGTAGL